MTTLGRTLDNRYVIRAEIGSGGFGAIYLAEDTRFTGNNQVAIKKISQSNEHTARAFQYEANLLYNLSHPNLPKVTNCFQEGESNYIVMDYIAGDDLMVKLKRGKKFTVAEVIKIADRVLDALEYLHSFLIFHRDIKPHNIKVDPAGKIYLLDFGTAKGQMDEATLSLTDQSITGYTPFYAPLEQILRVDTNSYLLLQSLETQNLERFMQNKTDARSDIYGLGATLYHLLTGFSPERATATIRAHFLWSGKADSLPECRSINPEIPVFLAEIVHKCLEIDPEDRFQTAAETRAALINQSSASGASEDSGKKIEPDAPGLTQPIVHFDEPKPPARDSVQTVVKASELPAAKRPWGWFIGAPVLVLCLTIAAGWLAWSGLKDTPGSAESAESELSKPGASPQARRNLTYSLLVQKMRDGKKFQEPFESSGQEIFESGYQFQLRLTSPDDGFLYVFNEGLNKNGEKYFSVVFPTPRQNEGRTAVRAGEQYQSGVNEFRGMPGTENFWIIWSREKSEPAELAVRNAFDSIGKVSGDEAGKVIDARISENLRNYLERENDAKAIKTKDTEKKLSNLDFEGDAIVYLLNLEHR